MYSGRVAIAGNAVLAALLAVGCGEESRPSNLAPTTTSNGGTGGTGGTSTSGTGGQGAAGGAGGQGGGSSTCGNGQLDDEEPCDGTLFEFSDCSEIGYDGGELSCDHCQLVVDSCFTVEDCFDGEDNDGDNLRDCNDDDCSDECSDSCNKTASIADPGTKDGDTSGHAHQLDVSCGLDDGTREIVYQVQAQTTGMLDVFLTSSADLNLSVRTSCSSLASEIACVERVSGPSAFELLSIPATANDTFFIIVNGNEEGESGPFTLSVESHTIACGNGHIEPPSEWCDDGNTTSGDGCSSICEMESTETEPDNNQSGGAETYAEGPMGWGGTIAPQGDIDLIEVEVTTANTTLVADVFDTGDGACSFNLLQSRLRILDTDGSSELASDDDSGQGTCSSVSTVISSTGTYFVEVSAAPTADSQTFAYYLDVDLN